jgi:hypothetical protein
MVFVSRGDELPKKNFETKTHPTYNTCISLKEAGQWSKPITVVKFFDQYRSLSTTLVTLGVKLEDGRHFPPTKRRSMIGIKISEGVLQERCFMLNQWMQAIFTSYRNFSPETQDAVWEFISVSDQRESELKRKIIQTLSSKNSDPERAQFTSLPTPPPHPSPIAPATTTTTTTTTTTDKSISKANTAPVHNGHVKCITAPTSGSTIPAGSKPNVADSKTGHSRNGSSASTTLSTKGTPVGDNVGATEVDTTTGLKDKGSPIARVSVTSVAYVPPTLHELELLSVARYFNDFLMVHVTQGVDMIPKSVKNTGKLHTSYEVRLSVVPYAAVSDSLSCKREVDVEAYEELHLQEQITITCTFNKFRDLKQELEKKGVASINSKADGKEIEHVIAALFPKTYTKSSLGISLTDAELDERTILLNNWLGGLLSTFSAMPDFAQDQVLAFLTLDGQPDPAAVLLADGPVLHGAIIEMLKGKFLPPLKPAPDPTSKDDRKKPDARPSNRMSSMFSGKLQELESQETAAAVITSTSSKMSSQGSTSGEEKEGAIGRPVVARVVSFLSGKALVLDKQETTPPTPASGTSQRSSQGSKIAWVDADSDAPLGHSVQTGCACTVS